MNLKKLVSSKIKAKIYVVRHGITYTEETHIKISQKTLDIQKTEETRTKKANARQGKSHLDKTRVKIIL